MLQKCKNTEAREFPDKKATKIMDYRDRKGRKDKHDLIWKPSKYSGIWRAL